MMNLAGARNECGASEAPHPIQTMYSTTTARRQGRQQKKASRIYDSERAIHYSSCLSQNRDIGRCAAVVFQQIYFRVSTSKTGWVYNTYEEWVEDLKNAYSKTSITRAILKLENLGFLESEMRWCDKEHRLRKWYTLGQVVGTSSSPPLTKMTSTPYQNDKPIYNDTETSTEIPPISPLGDPPQDSEEASCQGGSEEDSEEDIVSYEWKKTPTAVIDHKSHLNPSQLVQTQTPFSIIYIKPHHNGSQNSENIFPKDFSKNYILKDSKLAASRKKVYQDLHFHHKIRECWLKIIGRREGSLRFDPERIKLFRNSFVEFFDANLEKFQDFCEYVKQSHFLMHGAGKDWTPGLDWVLKPANLEKIISGEYHNDRKWDYEEKIRMKERENQYREEKKLRDEQERITREEEENKKQRDLAPMKAAQKKWREQLTLEESNKIVPYVWRKSETLCEAYLVNYFKDNIWPRQ